MAIYFGETDNDLSVTFTVKGKPQGKQRPRVTRHGTYTPEKTRNYEKAVQWEYMMQCQGAKFPDLPLMVVIDAYFAIPKATSKEKREAMIAGSIRPTVKPDNDNIAKSICDALNGEAYKDDAQIVSLIVRKWYGEVPRCEVQIRTVETG